MSNPTSKYPKLKMKITYLKKGKEPQSREISIELYDDTTPLIVESFKEACGVKKLDDKVCKRITPNAMLEWAAGENNNPICEVNFGRRHASAGVLTTPIIKGTYTTAGPAQFGICTSPMPWLDSQNVVVGRVLHREDLRFLDFLASRAGTLTGLPHPHWTVTLASCEFIPKQEQQSLPTSTHTTISN